jgi:hypothetical protein
MLHSVTSHKPYKEDTSLDPINNLPSPHQNIKSCEGEAVKENLQSYCDITYTKGAENQMWILKTVRRTFSKFKSMWLFSKHQMLEYLEIDSKDAGIN